MIICRCCLTRNDDGVTECTGCGTDLTGDAGVRTGQVMRRDWDAGAGPEPPPPGGTEPRPPSAPASPVIDLVAEGPIDGDRPAGTDGMIELPSDWRPTSAKAGATPRAAPDSSASAVPPAVEDVPASDGAARRRGRRPGEQTEVEAEPDTYSGRFRLAPDGAASGRHVDAGASDPLPAAGTSSGLRSTLDPAPTSPIPGFGGRTDRDAAVGAPLAAGMVACRACRRANADTLRFCRYCAATLPAFDHGDVEPDVELAGDPWWRRLAGTTRTNGRDGRTFGQRMRDSGQHRLTYRAKYTLRTKLRALGFVAGGAGALLLALGPLRNRVSELLDPPPAVPVAAVELDETPAVADAYGPENANDEDRETALVLPWSGEPVSFTFQLEPETDPDELEFVTGFPNDDEQGRGPLFKRPATMEVTIGDETMTVELEDHEGGQRIDLDVSPGLIADGATATVTIRTVHDRAWDTYDRVAIAEIAVVG